MPRPAGALLAGARGVISVTANVAPRRCRRWWPRPCRGSPGEARALDEPLVALHRDLFLEANPIPVKWLLAQMGHDRLWGKIAPHASGGDYQAEVRAAAQPRPACLTRAGIV